MHSGKFKSGLVLFSFIAIFATVSAARADGDPVKGRKAIAIRMDELDGQIKKLDAEIKAEEAKNEPDETKLQSLNDQRSKLQGEFNTYRHKSKAADRKYDKVVRDETNAEKQQQIIDETAAELKKGVESGTLSQDQIAELQQKIQDATAEKKRLLDRVARKEKQYKKKVGEDMPDRCEAPLYWNDAAKSCLPKCTPPAVLNEKGECEVPRKVASDEDKKKLDECYTKDEKPIDVQMYAHFSLGKSEVPTGSTVPGDADLQSVFETNATAVQKALVDGGYSKIWKLDSTGYASRVRGKTRTPAALSDERAKNATTSFTAFLKTPLEGEPRITETADLEKTNSTPDKIELGPNWTPDDYKVKSRRKITDKNRDALVTKYAQAILASKDPTPVKVIVNGKADLEATKKKLAECCDMSEATLKYQPYQYTAIKVYGAKFTPNTEACTTKADQVVNTVSSKTLPTEGDGGTLLHEEDFKNGGNAN